MVEGRACRATLFQTDLGLAQKQLRILEQNHPHPGPLPSDGRGRIVLRRLAYPTALEAASDRSGCSLSLRTGEGQGEGRFVGITPPSGTCFCTNPYLVPGSNPYSAVGGLPPQETCSLGCSSAALKTVGLSRPRLRNLFQLRQPFFKIRPDHLIHHQPKVTIDRVATQIAFV